MVNMLPYSPLMMSEQRAVYSNYNMNIFMGGFMPPVGFSIVNPQMLLMLLMLLMMFQGYGYLPMPLPMPMPMPMPMPIPYPVPTPTPRPVPYPVPTPIPRPVPTPPDRGILSHNSRNNSNTYITPGGWKIIQQGHTVKIISPEGKVTKIWGDPHVKEADGSKWQWKTKTATFMLPDGTKITMNATGPRGVVTSLDIYTAGHGDHVHINANNGTYSRSFNRHANYLRDESQADGATYTTKNRGEDWHVIYNESRPGVYNTHVKDRDFKHAENAHQRLENTADTFRRNALKIVGYSALGGLMGTIFGPVGTGLGLLLGGLAGYYS